MSIIVSHSETGAWQTCQRKWYYGFALGLRAVKRSPALSYGILGHTALEVYYKALKGGADRKQAYALAISPIIEHITPETDPEKRSANADVADVVMDRFSRYVKYWNPEQFRVLEVEKTFITTLDPDNQIDYALTFDVLAEMTRGPYKGEVVIIDHKWCYNFWTQDELDMHPQLPKYIWAMRHHGYPVKYGMVNQIRYRSFKDKKWNTDDNIFRRSYVEFNDTEIESVMADQKSFANEIDDYAGQPVATTAIMVRRSRDRRVCKECPYKLPCKIEAEGRDASTTLAVAFEPTTYGYRTRINEPDV